MNRCKVCDKEITEGFIIDYEEYYCEEECLHQAYSKEEYETLYEEGLGFWTIFEEEDE